MPRSALVASVCALSVIARPSAAQEFTGLFGAQTSLSFSAPTTYQWRLDYQQGLGERWYLETGWVNDGHFPGHARDGVALQLGARTRLGRRAELGIALGVDRFYDTVDDSTNPAGFADVQGFMGIGSAQLSWYRDRWIIRLQSTLEKAPPKSYDAWSLLLGLGYQLQAPDQRDEPRAVPVYQGEFTTGNEVTVFLGQTVPNGGKSDPKGISGSVEWRHGVWRYVDVTVSWINQSDNAVLSRVGLASQLWPSRTFGDCTLGIGLGAYFAVDQDATNPDGSKPERVAGLVSPTFSYRFSRHWLGRFIWNRTVTGNSTNTDFFGLGVGYRW